MSAGPRIPLPRAVAAAEAICHKWGMVSSAYAIVGSVRRRRAEVGDIEIVGPLPSRAPPQVDLFGAPSKRARGSADVSADELYERMLPGMLLRNTCPTHGRDYLAVETVGFKPGFLECRLMVNLSGVLPGVAGTTPVPVQIFRYSACGGNRGWCELMRTGPREFGIGFLVRWKAAFGIPRGERASLDGWLIDSKKNRIEVRTEDDCFRLAGMKPVPPEERDEYAAGEAAGRYRDNLEAQR